MAYADYSFYTDQYYGDQISETDFPRLAERATDFVRAYTYGISDKVSGFALEMVQKCTCAIAEIANDEDKMTANAFAAGGVKTGETVGPWSKSFSSGLTGSAIDYLEKRRKDVIWIYLRNLREFSELFVYKSYRCVHDARRNRT